MIRHEEDVQLVRRLMAGDEREFQTFYDDYYDRVYRFCLRRIGDREVACDLVQQTLIRVFKYLGSYRGEASLYTWVCQICRNEISDWYKSKKNQPALHVAIDDDPSIAAILESEGVGEIGERDDTVQLVHLALDALSPKYSKALQLKYLEGLSTREISQVMRLSEPAAQSVLARARLAFRQLMTDLLQESRDAART